MALVCTKSFHFPLNTVYVVFKQNVCGGVGGSSLGRGAFVGILWLFSRSLAFELFCVGSSLVL